MLTCGLIFIFAVAGRQQICLGQNYFEINADNKVIGNTASFVDAEAMMRECRRELVEMTGSYACLDTKVEVKKKHRLFTRLQSTDEVKEALLLELKRESIGGETMAYTVHINDFSASFATLDEVGEFLLEVKAQYDTEQQFHVAYVLNDDHSEATFSAELTKDESMSQSGQSAMAQQQEQTGNSVCAGAVKDVGQCLSYAMEHPGEKNYETGLVGLGFSQEVTVYTDFVQTTALTDVATAVGEVTKEQETNKIYEVEAGDCLSTIAEENGTTVEQIMALNGLTDENSYICIGDEIIISVPQPELSVWVQQGVVYEEDYNADPDIVGNDAWYTTEQVVLQEGTTGHREVNAVVTCEDGVETARTIVHQTVMTASVPAVVEQGTQIPPTYIKPVSGGRFTSGFGKRWGRMHKGVDWACPTGTTIYASSEGVVEYADWSSGYGYNVIIDHPDGRKTRYCHLSKTLVTAGQQVSQGQTIALSGSTGHSTGPHVHFEIFINGTQVDPLDYIN